MKTKLSENDIRERFSSRRWAVRLSVNGQPVNHAGLDSPAVPVNYYPLRGEMIDAALARLANAVGRARLLFGPVMLGFHRVVSYPEPVLCMLIDLLRRRRKSSPERSRCVVNLWLDEDDPRTAEVVERITGQPVSAWIGRRGGRRCWDVETLTWELRTEQHQHLFQRLSSRRWPLRLMVNGEPVGYGLGVDPVVVEYDPAENGGLERFVSAVAAACVESRRQPTILLVRHAESCPDDVVEYMARVLNDGMTWADGTRTEYEPTRLALDLKLNPTDDAAWSLVDYILEYQKTNSQ